MDDSPYPRLDGAGNVGKLPGSAIEVPPYGTDVSDGMVLNTTLPLSQPCNDI